MRVTTARDAIWQPGRPDLMIGDARLRMFDIPAEQTTLTAMMVELRDGARTAWHSHPQGQILIAVAGLGHIQADGE